MIDPSDLNALQAMMPDKWMVRKIDPGGTKQNYWIAANPRTMEGRIFAKDEHNKALDYVNEKNRYEAEQQSKADAIIARNNRKGESG